MTSLILLAVWTMVVLGAIAAITRPWRIRPRPLLALALGIAGGAWVLGTGYFAFSQMMTDGAWTGASIAMGYVPAKAIVLSLITYYAGLTFTSARQHGPDLKRWVLPSILAVAALYIVSSDVTRLTDNALEQHARNPALTQDDVSALVQKIKSGAAKRHETYAFLSNPRCPPDLLREYVASPEAYWRMAVASNDTIDTEIAEKLVTDPDEQVRYYLAFNHTLPVELLSRLAADKSESVRDIVARAERLPDDAFEKLVADPSAKVRSTVALQSRISDRQREILQSDPEQRVRDAANRWASN